MKRRQGNDIDVSFFGTRSAANDPNRIKGHHCNPTNERWLIAAIHERWRLTACCARKDEITNIR